MRPQSFRSCSQQLAGRNGNIGSTRGTQAALTVALPLARRPGAAVDFTAMTTLAVVVRSPRHTLSLQGAAGAALCRGSVVNGPYASYAAKMYV